MSEEFKLEGRPEDGVGGVDNEKKESYKKKLEGMPVGGVGSKK